MIAKKGVIFTILLIVCLGEAAQAATVHGTIYAWSDFEKPLKNAIVEVNSTPVQSKVATDGLYSFDLPNGSYSIKAKYYRGNILELTNEEQILIDSEGNFTIDLLLFPPTESESEFLGDINLTNVTGDKNDEDQEGKSSLIITVLIFILLFASILIFYISRKKKAKVSETEKAMKPGIISENESRKLPDDIKALYDIILNSGGRLTQKELRKKTAFSEAKVSLMIADLEDRGLVKKIKKGRANIIIAETQN